MSGSSSVQTFYKRELLGEIPANKQSQSLPGDGFTDEEIAAALDPLSRKFKPNREYEECHIGSLEAGPKSVKFTGRVVNFSVTYGRSKSHTSASGWCHFIVRDGTGAICVKAFFSREPYPLRMGTLISIWTSFISTSTTEGPSIPNAPLLTNIFPSRDTSVHMLINKEEAMIGEYRIPLGYKEKSPLTGLMTLKNYLSGGFEVLESKILVCVKSMGSKKVIKSKRGLELGLVEVQVFDETAATVLKLWNQHCLTAREWTPGETILLVSSPKAYTDFNGRMSFSMGICTFMDVDPKFRDAEWLRNYVSLSRKQECVSQVFPEGIWDVGAAVNGVNRVLFTLAEVDDLCVGMRSCKSDQVLINDSVRANQQHVFTGFLSVIIMELSLAVTRQRNMLMCGDCCGVPIYSNTLNSTCKNCDKEHALTLNPKIVGGLIDETACIESGKLLWSDQAWQQFWGMSIEGFLQLPMREIRLLEQRMMFMRVTLVFGWSDSVGRLAVLAVTE